MGVIRGWNNRYSVPTYWGKLENFIKNFMKWRKIFGKIFERYWNSIFRGFQYRWLIGKLCNC